MPPQPLSHAIAASSFRDIRLIATDMDGTLTITEKFTAQLLQTFNDLSDAGIAVLIVTGRSAGWVSGLVQYLPIWGAIAENGGTLHRAFTAQTFLPEISDIEPHRQQLARMFQKLRMQFPSLHPSFDNSFRLTDWTFDIADLSLTELRQMQTLCAAAGWGFTYSTVQCHIKLPWQEKAIALQAVVENYFNDLSPKQIVTIGDSPNDESLFDHTRFPLSVGVANLHRYCDRLTHQPTYITEASEGLGFIELAQMILNQRPTQNS